MDESNHQGEFLGVRFTLTQTPGDSDSPMPSDAVAVFADRPGRDSPNSPPGPVRKARLSTSATVPTALRTACLANVLHVIPSNKHEGGCCGSQWRKAPEPNASKSSAAGWHGKAVKFAARDLNQRYKKRFGTEMNSNWLGRGGLRPEPSATP